MSGPIVAVVLAAGAGTRFDGDGHKLLADLDGRPVVHHAVAAAVEAAVGPVVVVTGATPLDDALADLLDTGAVSLVPNPRADEGQARSLQVGVRAADALGASAVVVGLGDMPWVGPGPWRAVATAPADDDAVVVAAYPGPDGARRRPPVRIPRSRWAELPAAGDEGARVLLRARPDLVVAVPVDGDPGDVDVASDLRGPGT